MDENYYESEKSFSFLAIKEENAKRINDNEKDHPLRNKFQRDRDRIMYSRAFRRLSGKTQVFLSGKDDHVRTRLTHTLEVCQIARTISKILKLNEDLTEAIALGHDIGHTPFGHVGERMLNNIMNGCYDIRDFNNFIKSEKGYRGFKHNWQSIRVATKLEPNLNLTDYTLWGILNHSGKHHKKCKNKDQNEQCLLRHIENRKCEINLTTKEAVDFYHGMKIYVENEKTLVSIYEKIKKKWSFEGLLVAIADEIAQRHHDIEDALEYTIIDKNELLKHIQGIFDIDDYEKEIMEDEIRLKEEEIEQHRKNIAQIEKAIKDQDFELYKSRFSRFIVNILTTDVIANTRKVFDDIIKRYNIQSQEDFLDNKIRIEQEYRDIEKLVGYSSYIKKADKRLQNFLKNRILNSHKAQTMDGVGQHIIKELFKAYVMNPQQLPDKTIAKLFKNLYEKNQDKLKEFENENNNLNVGMIRGILSEYHFNRKKDADYEKYNYEEYKLALLRTICDYISGMTDKYTIEQHRKLYNIQS